VRDLQEGLEMIEEVARHQLGLVRPNEIFVQIRRPEPAAAAAPSPPAPAAPVQAPISRSN
jgi:cell division protein FtsB